VSDDRRWQVFILAARLLTSWELIRLMTPFIASAVQHIKHFFVK